MTPNAVFGKDTRGYAVSTLGFELEQVRKYIREQELADGNPGQF